MSPDEAREQAREILSQRRFEGTEAPRPLERPLRWLGDRLEELGAGLGAVLPGGDGFGLLVLALLVVGLAAVVAHRGLRGRAVAGAATALGTAGDAADPRSLEREADAAERASDHARAVRLRFRAGLLRLVAAERIEARPGLTTGDVAAALRSPAFDALGADFDAIAYGGRPAEYDYVVQGVMVIKKPIAAGGDETFQFRTDAARLSCPTYDERRDYEIEGWRFLARRYLNVARHGAGRGSPGQRLRTDLEDSGRPQPITPAGGRDEGVPWNAHHIIPVYDRRARPMQALLFRCTVHPNLFVNGAWLRARGLRNDTTAYTRLPAEDQKRAYHPETYRNAYFNALEDVFRINYAFTSRETCDKTAVNSEFRNVLDKLQFVYGELEAGRFDVGRRRR